MSDKKSNRKWWQRLGNKYVIASVLLIVWLAFFDENNVVDHLENKKKLQELEQQKDYYKEKIVSDKQKLKDLNAGKESLEKFAREEYYMSKPDEDIFIIEEKEK